MAKKSSKYLKSFYCCLTAAVVVLSFIVIFSPYRTKGGFRYKLISHTITIEAPVDSVFKFLGNSGNASRWSVYVDHIVPLNGNQFKDGVSGSRRRCYCNPDKSGTRWDELITEVAPNLKRQLLIYNMQDFPMTATGLATEQLYQSLPNKQTLLTFTVFFKDGDPSLLDAFKTYLAAYKIKDIFTKNMANIKRIVEKENPPSRKSAGSVGIPQT